MSLVHSPSIVTNGLVFYYDQNNIKSYKGPTVQNLANNIGISGTGTATGYSSVGTTEVVNVPQVGQITSYRNTIQNNYTVYTPNSGNCCPSLHNWGNITVTPSTLYTYLILYKCDSGYTSSNYMYRYEFVSNGGTYVTEGGVHSEANRVHLGSNWYYAWGTFTTQATTTWLGHCGTFYYRYSNVPDNLSVAKVAIIPGNYSGMHPKFWPNTATTRSNTQAILDLTNNNTITASSLTYASDGSFSFNGTTGYLSLIDNSILNFQSNSFSIAFFMNGVTQTATYPAVIGKSSGDFTTSLSDRRGWMFFYHNSLSSYLFGLADQNNNSGTSGDVLNFGNLNTSTWKYITIVVSSTNISGYINASFSPGSITRTRTGSVDAVTLLNIGRWASYSRYFNGQIDGVKLYNKALSANEIQQNFNATRGRYGL